MDKFKEKLRRRGNKRFNREIDPDEIFLDSKNLPEYNISQFEGRIEKPIKRRTTIFLGVCFAIIFCIFIGRAWNLEVKAGAFYADTSEKNHLRTSILFPQRGSISDRNGVPLATNVPSSESEDFAARKYTSLPGFSDLLGFVKYPTKDKSGFYYSLALQGQDGIEKYYDSSLVGEDGLRIIETNATGNIQSASAVRPAKDGTDLTLTIDSRIQSEFYTLLQNISSQVGFSGGAAAMMNVQNGELVALTSFPEYNSQVMTDGDDAAAIAGYANNKNNPFLNRAINGLYTPGSIVKPYMGVAALEQGVISPDKKILSTGSISIQNPNDPSKQSIFNDWRPQGWIDLRDALAVSSDVYFYEVGGGYQDQKGIGIANIEKYTRLFGFGSTTGQGLLSGKMGTIPDPAWKAANFNGDSWRIGDTYHTAIGQYGFQVTPLQVIRAVSSIANGGTLFQPKILMGEATTSEKIPVDPANIQIVREGMREGVTTGISGGLNVPYVQVADKTGTAELGTQKKYVNSWVTGFFPYDHPQYAFTILLEKGPEKNTTGALYVMRQMLDWMNANTPEYFK